MVKTTFHGNKLCATMPSFFLLHISVYMDTLLGYTIYTHCFTFSSAWNSSARVLLGHLFFAHICAWPVSAWAKSKRASSDAMVMWIKCALLKIDEVPYNSRLDCFINWLPSNTIQSRECCRSKLFNEEPCQIYCSTSMYLMANS